MKRILLVFTFILSLNSFSQNDLLGEWFVHKIDHNGTEYINNYSNFFNIRFFNNTLNEGYEANGSLICNGYGAVYNIIDENSINIYTTGITLSECGGSDENLYESNYIDIIFDSNNQSNPKELSFQIIGSGNTASLILTSSNGNYAVYGRQTLSLNSIKSQLQISVFPNPVDDILTIDNKSEIVNYIIYDLNGRLINDLQNASNKIDVSKLNPGIYFLKLMSDSNKTQTLKFLKL
jgi:hypothetical protein